MKVSEAKAAHEAALQHLRVAARQLKAAQEKFDYCLDEFDRTAINITHAERDEPEKVKEPMPTPQELANHAEALHRMKMAF
jgi:hypothetical protein